MSLPAKHEIIQPKPVVTNDYRTMMRRVEEDLKRWGPLQADTENGMSTLHLDDLTGIPFTESVVGVQLYQLRARVRAGTGDLFAATCPTMIDYEWYNRKILKLGSPTFIHAFDTDEPANVAGACRNGCARHHLVALATQRGGLLIHPYMGILSVWELAEELATGTHAPIKVLAPTPAATQLANNKVFFTEFIQEHFSASWVAPSRTAVNAQGMALAMFELAQTHPRIALKMPECASATGIKVFESADVLAVSPARLLDTVRAFLSEKQWVQDEPVQIVAWLKASHSPSTQVWVPAGSEAPPVVEGIYEQLFTGSDKVFLGSVPSPLPNPLQARMKEMSLAVATKLKGLGYIGRCSFDFIISDGRPIFIECNGRWGGTSTPMNLVDRLFPDGRPPYLAKDVQDDRLIGCSFKDVAKAFGSSLYRAETGEGRYILYNVGCLTEFGKFDVIVLGANQEAATDAARNELPAILAKV